MEAEGNHDLDRAIVDTSCLLPKLLQGSGTPRKSAPTSVIREIGRLHGVQDLVPAALRGITISVNNQADPTTTEDSQGRCVVYHRYHVTW